ncbi:MULTISPECIES: ATP synthase subunit I [Vibrio]|uniref:ATP synthase subunit I n=1 Tax=Vibrio algicola TaxID=2662262 RepID=A0A5Q0TKA7_9VIBR|nr:MULTISPECIES: ATP synthase subunit I [Vibrio]MBD1576401.1 ATP synthase subunit I [Vibrio sp. S11_S32]
MFFLVLTQFIVVGAFSLISLYVQGEMASQSAIFGGLVCSVPYIVTCLYLNKPGADTAAKVMAKAYVSVIYKFVISGALFVFFFKYTDVHLITFFVGYILAFVVQCIMSLVLSNVIRQDI